MKNRYRLDNKGNISVITAISLIVLVGILALVVDGGYFFTTKNKWQNGVEAACLAGAAHLCDEDYESVMRRIAVENGLPGTSGEGLTVSRGFYDVEDEYGDFSVYKNFVADNADDFPEEEYGNAVLVSLDSEITGFFSGLFGREKVRVKAESMVYLTRIGMAALNDDSEIRIGANTTMQNSDIYSNGYIKFQDSDYEYTSGWWPKDYHKPEFVNVNLYARLQVQECPATAGSKLDIDWDSGVSSSMSNAFSGSPRLTSIPSCDDDYIESLRSTADVVYEIDDAASDMVFWCKRTDNSIYVFDLTGEREHREVIFFDAQGSDVVIADRTYCVSCAYGCDLYPGHPDRTSNGERISNVTFITNGNILMDRQEHIWGDEGYRQAVIITSGDVMVVGNTMEGIVYRLGGDFETHPASHGRNGKVRIIADGDILLHQNGYPTGYNWSGITDFKFGPPSPFEKGVFLSMPERVGE